MHSTWSVGRPSVDILWMPVRRGVYVNSCCCVHPSLIDHALFLPLYIGATIHGPLTTPMPSTPHPAIALVGLYTLCWANALGKTTTFHWYAGQRTRGANIPLCSPSPPSSHLPPYALGLPTHQPRPARVHPPSPRVVPLVLCAGVELQGCPPTLSV